MPPPAIPARRPGGARAAVVSRPALRRARAARARGPGAPRAAAAETEGAWGAPACAARVRHRHATLEREVASGRLLLLLPHRGQHQLHVRAGHLHVALPRLRPPLVPRPDVVEALQVLRPRRVLEREDVGAPEGPVRQRVPPHALGFTSSSLTASTG